MERNIIVAGVGGQGSILASHIIAEAAIRSKEATGEELNVRVGETFGAAQRGGAVASHVRIGDIHGPLVRKGRADLVVALEPLEGLRIGLPYLAKDGVAIVNTISEAPVDAKVGAVEYPALDAIEGALKQMCKKVVMLDARSLALEAGSAKAVNVVMLGAAFATGTLPYSEEIMLNAIKAQVPAKAVDLNLKAFALGKEAFLKS